MTKNLQQNLWFAASIGIGIFAGQITIAHATEANEATTRDIVGQPNNARNAQLENKIAAQLEEQSRFTLSLRQEPLSDMMALLENATAVRFRCGTLPDALISVNAQDAPLLATIEPIFQDMGFAMRRDGLNLFVFSNRATGDVESTPNQPLSWNLWKGNGAPPPGWMNARADVANAFDKRVTAEALIHGSAVSVGWNAPRADNLKNAAWQPLALQLDTSRRPGIGAAVPKNDKESPVWMRWPLTLREVPPGAQLLIETPSDVTLFVNGAPLLSNRRGLMLVDLGRVLQRGTNCLALHWPRVSSAQQEAPLLRYEWFIAGKMNAPAAASLAAPLYETPSISQPLLNRPNGGPRPGEAGATIAETKRR